MRIAIGCVMVLAASCFVPTLQVDDRASDGGGGSAGGAGGALSCDDLFPPAWPTDCAECIHDSVCCDAAAGDCAGDPACAEAARCLAGELHPAGARRCTGEQGLVGYQSYVYALACASERCGAACFGATWSCAGLWSPPELPLGEGKHDVTIRIAELEDGTLVDQVNMSACERDTDCATPIDATQMTPWGGAVFNLPLPFDGYFDLEAGFVNVAVRIFLPELWSPSDYSLRGPNPESIETILANAGKTLEPGKGHVFVHVTDCTVTPAPHVRVAVADQEAPDVVYLDGSAVENATATTATGDAFILNVEPGNTIAVTGTVDGDEKARATIRVLADEYSYVWLEPRRQGQ